MGDWEIAMVMLGTEGGGPGGGKIQWICMILPNLNSYHLSSTLVLPTVILSIADCPSLDTMNG